MSIKLTNEAFFRGKFARRDIVVQVCNVDLATRRFWNSVSPV